MGTYRDRTRKLRELMGRRYRLAHERSKDIDMDMGMMADLPGPDGFDAMPLDQMADILDRLIDVIDSNRDKLRNPTCATCVHLHDNEWARRYGKACCPIFQICDNYVNPNRRRERRQRTYVRRPSNKACPNYSYGEDNFENRRRCLKRKNTR